jgi:hypothetical protein
MRAERLARSVGVLSVCAVVWGCGASDGEGSGVERGGTAGQGGGGAPGVGGLSIGGSESGSGGDAGGKPNNGGSANSAGTSSNAGTSSGGSGGTASTACMELTSAEQTMLFEQAPHCTETFDYELEGSIDGGMVHDIRDGGFSGGYVNGNTGRFETPSGTSSDPSRVKIRFLWTKPLAHGDSCTTVDGIVVPPTGNPRAGQELCITQGVVGFVEGGPDDGNFKFHLYGARAGSDCSGEEVPIDLRGCM